MGQQQGRIITSGELEEVFKAHCKRGASLADGSGAATLNLNASVAMLERLAKKRGIFPAPEFAVHLQQVNTLADIKRCVKECWEQAQLSTSLSVFQEEEANKRIKSKSKSRVPLSDSDYDCNVTHVTVCGLGSTSASLDMFYSFVKKFGFDNVDDVFRQERELGLATLLVCYRRGLDKNVSRYITSLVRQQFAPARLHTAYCDMRADTIKVYRLFQVSVLAVTYFSLGELLREGIPDETLAVLLLVPNVGLADAMISASAKLEKAINGASDKRPRGWRGIKVVSAVEFQFLPNEMPPNVGGYAISIDHSLSNMFRRPLRRGRTMNWNAEQSYVYPMSHSAADSWSSSDQERSSPSVEPDASQQARFCTMGASEHASIASFAVFSMQLLACGAPMHLVREAHEAALDEIRHAKLAFTLARRYGAHRVHPSRSRAEHEVHVGASVAQLALSTARDACVNETMSCAADISDLLAEKDPLVRSALQEVIRDETRHAELAWRTVRWCLQREGASLWAPLTALFQNSVYHARLQPLIRWLHAGVPDELHAILRGVLLG